MYNMKMRRMPAPAQLKPRRNSRNLIAFRLNDDEDDALRALAATSGMGPSTLARRIVEHYLGQHAPRARKRG
jgi:hypothetical protein